MDDLLLAQQLISRAKNFIILAGAGMSADVGLRTYWTGPNSRYGDERSRFGYTSLQHSDESLWAVAKESQIAYFQELHQHMSTTDVLADSSPYRILKDYFTDYDLNYFIRTTNVDSAFTRAGFAQDALYEQHGSYSRSQCLSQPAQHGVFPTNTPGSTTLCPVCGSSTRPNVLFFNDFHCNTEVMYEQQDRFADFVNSVDAKDTIVIEVGVGSTVPALRDQSSILGGRDGFNVVRVNPELDDYESFSRILPLQDNVHLLKIQMTAVEGLSRLFQLEEMKNAEGRI